MRQKNKSSKSNGMTAVNWLIEQLQASCKGIPSYIVEKAIEMEKQQIINSVLSGMENFIDNGDVKNLQQAQEFYDEIYK